MSSHKFFGVVVITFAGITLCPSARAENAYFAETPPNQTNVQVSLRSEEFYGDAQVQRVYFAKGTNQFAVMVPIGFRADASSSEKIVLSDLNSKYFISIRFVNASSDTGSDGFRPLVLGRFPSAEVSAEFTGCAGSHCGPGFDLRFIGAGGVGNTARIVYIPSAAGVLEFSLITSSSSIQDGRALLQVVLASFSTNENGKLVITPVSGTT